MRVHRGGRCSGNSRGGSRWGNRNCGRSRRGSRHWNRNGRHRNRFRRGWRRCNGLSGGGRSWRRGDCGRRIRRRRRRNRSRRRRCIRRRCRIGRGGRRNRRHGRRRRSGCRRIRSRRGRCRTRNCRLRRRNRWRQRIVARHHQVAVGIGRHSVGNILQIIFRRTLEQRRLVPLRLQQQEFLLRSTIIPRLVIRHRRRIGRLHVSGHPLAHAFGDRRLLLRLLAGALVDIAVVNDVVVVRQRFAGTIRLQRLLPEFEFRPGGFATGGRCIRLAQRLIKRVFIGIRQPIGTDRLQHRKRFLVLRVFI